MTTPRRLVAFLLVAAMLPVRTVIGAGAPAQLVPTPRAQVIATSPTNRPFLAAASTLQPVDLAARGYEESELLVSGVANIYQWAPGAATVNVGVPNVAYTTRILVRRPKEVARFSGRVIVELLNPSGLYDFAP